MISTNSYDKKPCWQIFDQNVEKYKKQNFKTFSQGTNLEQARRKVDNLVQSSIQTNSVYESHVK